MKKILFPVIVICSISFSVLADEFKSELLDATSKKITDILSTLPGEGITEANVLIKDEEAPSYSILAVRDISKTEKSNFFTQLGLHQNDVSSDGRTIGNFGLGYRVLSSDKSMMFGVNSFYDHDFTEGHKRVGAGAEASASILDLSLNWYKDATLMRNVGGTKEQALGGWDYNLTSQIPHMPWAKVNWQMYKVNADRGATSLDGDIYSIEMAISPYLQLDLSRDIGNDPDGNKYGALLTFVHPPRENKPTLADGFTSDEMFVKENMEHKLSAKVRRNNNIPVEIQGAVIFTKK